MNEKKDTSQRDLIEKVRLTLVNLQKMPESFEDFLELLKNETKWSWEFAKTRKELMTELNYWINFEKDYNILRDISKMLGGLKAQHSHGRFPRLSRVEMLIKDPESKELYHRYNDALLDAVSRVKSYIDENLPEEIILNKLNHDVVALFCLIIKTNIPEQYDIVGLTNKDYVKIICDRYKIAFTEHTIKQVGQPSIIIFNNIHLLRKSIYPLLEKNQVEIVEKAVKVFIENNKKILNPERN